MSNAIASNLILCISFSNTRTDIHTEYTKLKSQRHTLSKFYSFIYSLKRKKGTTDLSNIYIYNYHIYNLTTKKGIYIMYMGKKWREKREREREESFINIEERYTKQERERGELGPQNKKCENWERRGRERRKRFWWMGWSPPSFFSHLQTTKCYSLGGSDLRDLLF